MHALKGFVAKLDRKKDTKDGTNELRALDERDIYRYRKQRGVNLGSWFVLEKWISGGPFANAAPPASSDYDVACGADARATLEKHWDTWIVDDDWKWIAERGFDSVRLPIGYYHLVGLDSSVIDGTPFAKLGPVFEGAWQRILNAVNTAATYGIGVLIDLHSAPGKQNADSHSGIGGPVDFYKKSNLARTITVLKLLARTFASTQNVIGIELVNEPQQNKALPGWYRSALDSIRAVSGPDLPLYIHDAWNTGQYASFVQDRTDFVVLDHHLYRCFTSQDQTLSGDQHASALPRQDFVRHSAATRSNLAVAEFSAALNPKSYGQNANVGEQDRQRRVFARAQLALYEETCGGWWMWTYKKDGWDAGWSLRDTVCAEIMPNRVGHDRDVGHPNDIGERDTLCADALARHTQYWSTKMGEYEHWRFEAGFKQGWDDAFMFYSFTPSTVAPTAISEIGFMGQWILRRKQEHASSHGDGNHMWEFEHGFRQGSDAAWGAFSRS